MLAQHGQQVTACPAHTLTTRTVPSGASSSASRIRSRTTASRRPSDEPGSSYASCQLCQSISRPYDRVYGAGMIGRDFIDPTADDRAVAANDDALARAREAATADYALDELLRGREDGRG